jgi:hypothetical protein
MHSNGCCPARRANRVTIGRAARVAVRQDSAEQRVAFVEVQGQDAGR